MATIEFTATDLNDKPMTMQSRIGNNKCKLLLLVGPFISASSIVPRLQDLVGFISDLLARHPAVAERVEIIPYICLDSISKAMPQSTVKSVLGGVLSKLNLVPEQLQNMIAIDWDHSGMSSICRSISMFSSEIGAPMDSVEFGSDDAWALLADENGKIVSAEFEIPTRADQQKFANFVNDLISAVKDRATQDMIASGYSEFAGG